MSLEMGGMEYKDHLREPQGGGGTVCTERSPMRKMAVYHCSFHFFNLFKMFCRSRGVAGSHQSGFFAEQIWALRPDAGLHTGYGLQLP